MSAPAASIKLIEPELNGGKISCARIDSIAELPGERLEISGLRQDSFEYLIARYGQRFSHIRFWKCPRIEDLSPLASLPQIRALDFFHNQKATRLWDLAQNPALQSLQLYNFSHLRDVSDLARAPSLQNLELGNRAQGNFCIESLAPLADIRSLEALAFNPKKNKRPKRGRAHPAAATAQLALQPEFVFHRQNRLA